MDEFCYQAQLPKSINDKIRTALEYSSHKNILSNQVKEDFFESIPTKLKTNLAVSMFKGMITSVPFLKNKDNIFLANLLPMLQPLKINKGEYIFKKDSYPNLVYFIIDGKVNFLIGSNELVFKSFLAGSYFGEIEIFHQCLRLFSVKCEDSCELLTLDREYFNELMEKFPQVEQEMLQMAQKRQEFLNDSLEKIDMFLNINQNDNFWTNKEALSFAEILLRKRSQSMNPSLDGNQQVNNNNRLFFSSRNDLIATKNKLHTPLFSTREMKDNKNHQIFQDYTNEFQNQDHNINNIQQDEQFDTKNYNNTIENINTTEANMQNISQMKLINNLQYSQSYESKNNALFNSIIHTNQNYTQEYSTQNSNRLESQASIKQNNVQNSNFGIKATHQNSLTSIEKSLKHQQQMFSNYYKQSEINSPDTGRNITDDISTTKNIKIMKKNKLEQNPYNKQGSQNSNSSSNININSINEQSSLNNIPIQSSSVSLKNNNFILNVFNEKQEPMLVEVYEEDKKQTKIFQVQSSPSLKILNSLESQNLKSPESIKNINKIQFKYGVSSLDSIEEKNSHIDVENPSHSQITTEYHTQLFSQMSQQSKELEIKLQKVNNEEEKHVYSLDKELKVKQESKEEEMKFEERKEDLHQPLKIQLKQDTLQENANKISQLINKDEQQDHSDDNETQSNKNQFNQISLNKTLSNSIQDKIQNNSSSSPEYLILFGNQQNSNKNEYLNFDPISFSEAIQKKTNKSEPIKNKNNVEIQKNLHRNINNDSETYQFQENLNSNDQENNNNQTTIKIKNDDTINNFNSNNIINEQKEEITNNINNLQNIKLSDINENKQGYKKQLNRGNSKKKTIMKSFTLKLENEYDYQQQDIKNIQYSDRLDKIYNTNSQSKIQTPLKEFKESILADSSKNRSLQEVVMLDTSSDESRANYKQLSNQTKSSKQNIFNFIADFKNEIFDSDPQTEQRSKRIKRNQKTQTSFNTDDHVNQYRKFTKRQKQSKKTIVSVKNNIQQEKNGSTMQDFDIQSLNYLNKIGQNSSHSGSEMSSSIKIKDLNYSEIQTLKKMDTLQGDKNALSEKEEREQQKNSIRKASSKSKKTKPNECDSEDILQFSKTSFKEKDRLKKRCKSLGVRSKSNSSATKEPSQIQSQDKVKPNDYKVDAKRKRERIKPDKKTHESFNFQRGRKKQSRKNTQISWRQKSQKSQDIKNIQDDPNQTNQNSQIEISKIESQQVIKDQSDNMKEQSRSFFNFSRNISRKNSQQKLKNQGSLSIQNMMKPIEIDLQEEIQRKTKKLLKKMTLRSFDDICDSTPDYSKMMDDTQNKDKLSKRDFGNTSRIQNNIIKDRIKILKSMGSFRSQNSINSSVSQNMLQSNSNLSPQTPINKYVTSRQQLMDEKSKELTFSLMAEKENKQSNKKKINRGKSQVSQKSKKSKKSPTSNKGKKSSKNQKSTSYLKSKHKSMNFEIKGVNLNKQKTKENANTIQKQKSKKMSKGKSKQNLDKDQNKNENEKSNLVEMAQMRQNFSDISNKMDSLSQQYENMLNLVFLLTQEIQAIQHQGQMQSQETSRQRPFIQKPIIKKQVNKIPISNKEMEEINNILSDIDLQSHQDLSPLQMRQKNNKNKSESILATTRALLAENNNIYDQYDDYNQV